MIDQFGTKYIKASRFLTRQIGWHIATCGLAKIYTIVFYHGFIQIRASKYGFFSAILIKMSFCYVEDSIITIISLILR